MPTTTTNRAALCQECAAIVETGDTSAWDFYALPHDQRDRRETLIDTVEATIAAYDKNTDAGAWDCYICDQTQHGPKYLFDRGPVAL